MGLFSNQFSNVVEWEEYREDVLFWKWTNNEIKKGSKLIIRPGQDAIFLFNGKVEGVFQDEGSFDIESEIVPFLSTLKGFKFGFNSGMRAEVLFINTKEMLVKWGTKNAINIKAAGLPGGMPIRAFGTFNCKVSDYAVLVEKIAGIKNQFTVEEVQERVVSMLDQLLMKWIANEGKDMFNLQANAMEISKGIETDLDMEMCKLGIGITGMAIQSFSYPEEIKKMQEKAASQAMVGDINKYQQIAMADGMSNPGHGGSVAGDMVGIQMGMAMGQQMVNQMTNQMTNQATGNQAAAPAQNTSGVIPKFCPECGTATNGGKFCSNCGYKLA
ncbi:MAG: SPFH domain-containing protein [Lachnospiraceae bacterium]|nr:SPFH domain-containing protein [Lachnospiraceae bacterium]